MARRMIDTDFWNRPAVRGMKAPYKLLWGYMNCECDHAGIWIVELDIAAMRLGVKLDRNEALLQMSSVIEDYGDRWLITTFVEDQYRELNPANKVHQSVIQRLDGLRKEGASKGLPRGLGEAKDKEQDKAMVKDKEEQAPKVLFDDTGITPEEAEASNPKLQGRNIDFAYYTEAISIFSGKAQEKRTRAGWLATYRQFVRGDEDKGVLRTKTPAGTAADWNPRS